MTSWASLYRRCNVPTVFSDTQSASMRLSNSIVRYTLDGKSVPILIHDVNGDWSARFTNLLTDREGSIESVQGNEQLELRSVPLGFCQIGAITRYLMRMPRRRYKQGLSVESLYSTGPMRLPTFADSKFRLAIGNTIAGVYRTQEEVLKSIEDGDVLSEAVHRNWAFLKHPKDSDGSIRVLHKYYGGVGFLGEEGKAVLHSDWDWLQETLDGDLYGDNS